MQNKRTRVLGCNREEVDQYLDQVAKQQQAELASVQSQINLARQTLEDLERQKRSLEDERIRHSHQQRLLLLASEQLDPAQQALQNEIERQIKEERRSSLRRLALLEEQGSEADQQMGKLQQQIDEMLRGFAAVAGTDPCMPDREQVEMQPERDEPLVEQAETTRVNQRQHAESPVPSRQLPKKRESASFWDLDLEQVLGRTRVDPTSSQQTAQVTEPAPGHEGQGEAKQTREEPPTPKGSADTVTQSPADKQVTTESPAVNDEIRNVRYRYIVGKIAGEDLKDAQGQLIVAKNATITAEVVRKAEFAGRLPELIINMLLPGTSR